MKSQSGQALIEALLILTIATVGAIKVIKSGIVLTSQIVVEDSLESALICKFQRRTDCLTELRKKLIDARYRNINIVDSSTSNTARIRIEWEVSHEIKNVLESELSLDLKIN